MNLAEPFIKSPLFGESIYHMLGYSKRPQRCQMTKFTYKNKNNPNEEEKTYVW